MKNRLRILMFTALTLVCLLIPLCIANAITVSQVPSYLGEPSETDYDYTDIIIGQQSTIATVLDWMDDFMESRSGYTLYAATDLVELVAAVNSDKDPKTVVKDADQALALRLLRESSDLNAEIQYYYDKLQYCYVQCMGNLAEIRGGKIDPEQQEAYASEMTALINETEPIRLEAIGLITSSNGWQARTDALVAALDSEGVNAASIADIRDDGFSVLRKQAETLTLVDQTCVSRALGDGAAPLIKVISDKEIAFSLSLGDGNVQEVKDIPIWVRPYDPKHPNDGAWKKGVTGATGAVAFPIADFMPKDGEVCVEVIYNASEDAIVMDGNGYPKGANAKKPAYQRREVGILYMRGGDFYHTVLSKVETDEPYLIRATFNNRDMLTNDNGMWITSANDMLHTIAVKMHTAGEQHKFQMYQWKPWKGWHYLMNATFAANSDTVQINTQKFCCKSDPSSFVTGDHPLYMHIDPVFSQNGEMDTSVTTGKEKSNFKTPEAPHDDKDGSDSKGTGISGNLELTIPSNWPIIGGVKAKFPMDGPVEIKWEVGKVIKIGFNYPIKPKVLTWKSEDQKAQDTRLKEEAKKNAGATALSREGIANALSAHKKEKFLASSQASVTPYLYVMASFDFSKHVYTGSVNVGLIMAYKYEFTKQFFVGIIPAFLGLQFDFKLTLGLGIGVTIIEDPRTLLIKKIDFSKGSGFTFNPHLELALTVGAGLPKLAYVALKGTGWIDLEVILGKGGDPKVELGLKAEINVCVMFWSKTWLMWSYVYPHNSNRLMDYMTAAALNDALNRTIGLEEANALPGNYDQGVMTRAVGEVASESSIIQEMPCNSADIKFVYLRVGSNQYANYAFWMGNVKVNGADTSRILYKNLDNNSEVKELPTCDGTFSEYNVMEFDIDYMKNYVGVCYTVQRNPRTPFPADISYQDYYNAMVANSENITMLAAVYSLENNVFSLKIKENSRSFAGLHPTYTPRARFLRGNIACGNHANTDYYNFAYVGICLENSYSVTGKTIGLGDFNYRIFNLNLHYYWPDIQLLDFVNKHSGSQNAATPLVLVVGKPRDNEVSQAIFFSRGNGTGVIRCASNCDAIIPVRDRQTDDRYRVNAFMCLCTTADSKIQNGMLANTVGMLYFNNTPQTEVSYNDIDAFAKSLVIRDMGIRVSSDGIRTVTVRVNNQNQLYAYWVQSGSGSKVAGANDYSEKYNLMTCLIDTTKKATTPAFVWATLQKKGVKPVLLPVNDITKEKMTGFYMHSDNTSLGNNNYSVRYGMQKIEFPLTSSVSLLSFSPEYPVVCQGRDFSMFFRFQNTGSVVIRSAIINISAVKPDMDGATPVLIKGVKVDMDKAEGNAVTQYDLPDANGNPTVLKGKFAVYPVFDVMDAYSGNNSQYSETTYADTDNPVTQSGDMKISGLLPGSITTYKTNVTNSPTKWHGDYELFAELAEINYTMFMGDNETLFTARRNADDSFTTTYLDENGILQKMPSDGLLAYFADPLVTLDVNDNLTGESNLGDTADDSLYMTTNGIRTTDRVRANMGYNDLTLEANSQLIDGVEYAIINLSNEAFSDDGKRGAGVVPMVSALINGKVVKQIIMESELDGAFTRMLYVPMRELTNNQPYEELQLIVTSKDTPISVIESGDVALHAQAYKEVNLYANIETLTANHDFTVTDPVDVTIFEGDNASFAVTAEGDSAVLTYQWHVANIDGSTHPIAGATQSVCTVVKATMACNGLYYWCEVSDGRTIVNTNLAMLTVKTRPPVTGDTFPISVIIAMLCLSTLAIALVIRKRHTI